MQRKRKMYGILVVIALAMGLAGCGDSGTDTPATPGATTGPSATAGPGAATPPAETPAGDPDVGPLNVAVVTIGETRHEFTEVRCSIFTPRYIQAGNFGGDPEVSIVLPPDGWESQGDTFSPPSVRVSIGDEAFGQRWVAGDDGSVVITPLPDGASRIDAYTVPDGRPVKATGTGMFVDLAAHNRSEDAPSISGTFEVSCP